ncbi:hypothetical protein DRQ26_06880 [bacterium]|nr:MAG: hypothetical protein DRQ26_06880 [bacterium]
MNILITGATGFIGSALVNSFVTHPSFSISVAVRSDSVQFSSAVRCFLVGDLDADSDWSAPLQGMDVVIHTAARVHIQSDNRADSLTEFRRINVAGTLNLARQAKAAGVKRFIYLSSIKVNGEVTEPGSPFLSEQQPAPVDPYAVSKYEAETGLLQLVPEVGFDVVIIRPPLVYGPGVKANFESMLRWLSRGIPLPLGGIDNQRSLLALDNLIDLITICVDHPAAKNQIFLAADGKDLSTTELLQQLANALGRPIRLFPLPFKILEIGAILLGKRTLTQRLCGSLQVDISKAQELLGWIPPLSVDQGLIKTARWYKDELLHSS